MKYTLIMSALIGAASLASSPAFATETMTSATCQPLTGANYKNCCAANEWREVILPGEYRYCPPLNTSDKDSGRMGEVIVGNGTGNENEVPVPDPVVTGSIGGNPGNTKEVGGSGEQGMANEDPSTGNKGNGN